MIRVGEKKMFFIFLVFFDPDGRRDGAFSKFYPRRFLGRWNPWFLEVIEAAQSDVFFGFLASFWKFPPHCDAFLGGVTFAAFRNNF